MSKTIDPARTGELCAVLMRRFPLARPHLLGKAVADAQRAALTAKRASEHACNYAEDDAAYDRRSRRQDRKAAKLTTALYEACGLMENLQAVLVAGLPVPPPVMTVVLGGDPRGPCGWLLVNDENGKPMPGDGWAAAAGFGLY